jgi:hypothetical protein
VQDILPSDKITELSETLLKENLKAKEEQFGDSWDELRMFVSLN